MIEFGTFFLEKCTNGIWSKLPKSNINSFVFDSKKANNNSCFLALKGANSDGHLYLNDAHKNGAVAAIVEKINEKCELPQLKVNNVICALKHIAISYRKTLITKIFAVTGSSGKTSAKELLALLLGKNTFKTFCNFNSSIGLPISITQIDASINDKAVIEVSAWGPGTMDTEIVQPNVAILLNVGNAHVGNYDSFNDIVSEKIKLLNCSTDYVVCPKQFANLSKCKRTYWFESVGEDFYIGEEKFQFKHSNNGFDILSKSYLFHVHIKVGDKMIQTFAIMIWIAMKEGISNENIQKRLLNWRQLPNRGSWLNINHKKYFVDCYNANPEAFENSLQQFYRELINTDINSICYCLGTMEELGNCSDFLHKKVTSFIKIKTNDVFICIGKFANSYKAGLIANGASYSQVFSFQTTDEAKIFFILLKCNIFYLKGSFIYNLQKLIDIN